MGSSPLSRDFFLGALASTHTHVFVCVCVCVTSERRQFNEADRFLLLFLRKCLHLCKQATTWLEQRRKRQPILNVFFFVSLSSSYCFCVCASTSHEYSLPQHSSPFTFVFFFLSAVVVYWPFISTSGKSLSALLARPKSKEKRGKKKAAKRVHLTFDFFFFFLVLPCLLRHTIPSRNY